MNSAFYAAVFFFCHPLATLQLNSGLLDKPWSRGRTKSYLVGVSLRPPHLPWFAPQYR